MDTVCCLLHGARAVLTEPDPWHKQAKTEGLATLWHTGTLAISCGQPNDVPTRPARRDDIVSVVPPGRLPKLGRGGTLASRQVG
jgi:hypothetical protein